MKKILITILLLTFTKSVFAEPVYLWIKKTDEIKSAEQGSSEMKGDVIAITPSTQQYEPTPSELINVFVIKVDLTKEEQNSLMKRGDKLIDGVLYEDSITNKINKIDIDKLDIKGSKQEFTKNEVISKITADSVVVDNP